MDTFSLSLSMGAIIKNNKFISIYTNKDLKFSFKNVII